MRWIISFFLLHLLKRMTQSLIWFSSNHFELFVNTNTLCFWLSSHSPISFPCKLYSMNCDERYKMSYGTLFQNKLISFIRKAEWNFINLFIWCCKMYVTFVYNRMLSKTFFGNRKLFVVCFVFVDLFSWLFSRSQYASHMVLIEIVQTEKRFSFVLEGMWCYQQMYWNKSNPNSKTKTPGHKKDARSVFWPKNSGDWLSDADNINRMSCIASYRIVGCSRKVIVYHPFIRPFVHPHSAPISTNKTKICVLFHSMRFDHKSLTNFIRVWYNI